ncbi:molybdopterin-dependent oxidoreductase [Thiohalorhabdus sp. Cl-TMA]|uniref:Molybdopterin-dependent oxidoreductase n=1 Tax=Thiohalorhabdus methylotrophus TaxID=3242694 RepID=A0ABV4TTM4_9GAMM
MSEQREAGPVRTTCPYCGVGCGVRAAGGPEGAAVQGDRRHPANAGRLCSKGAALADTLDDRGRLLRPVVAGQETDWDTALDAVADGLRTVIDRHGPEAVALYCSGQLLTEDYYVANKLVKGYLGTANIDTNSRLCMASAVAGHKRAFGADAVPGAYADAEEADLVVLAGSNAAWTHPVWFQRLQAARKANPAMQVVVIDPRRTATCELADRHLALAPGTDAVLWNGLLVHPAESDAFEADFLRGHTGGVEEALRAARASAPSISAVAEACGLSAAEVAAFYAAFAANERTVTAFSQGVNQSERGTDQVSAILNVHLATGRIGRPGAGPFSLTGQPNAMGGREVGGLANQLAAHMELTPDAVDRLARFWETEAVADEPGPKAVELFDRIAEGRIKAVWIMATNPAVSLPDADRVRAALGDCELVVVSDCVARTDTTATADILLPAAAWGEKDGTVTNSERCISRQRPFRAPPGEARPDWWIMSRVARRLGFGRGFPYESPAAVFREHAALSGFENHGARPFDISALAGLSDAEYDALEPVQWPVNAANPRGTARLFSDGVFATADGRARLVPVEAERPAGAGSDGSLVLNTGRVRDQWHTMTRTGDVARLSEHSPEPYAALHPEDAAALGLADGALARLANDRGEVLARVRVDVGQRPGSVFVPFHWSGPFAARGRVDALVAPRLDAVSGQPASKHATVLPEPFAAAWEGLLLSRRPVELDGVPYWAAARRIACWDYRLAGGEAPADWAAWRRERLGAQGDWLELRDPGAGRYRAACLVDGRLEAVLFAGPGAQAADRAWLSGLFEQAWLDPGQRNALLAGRLEEGAGTGPAVCACFGVDAAQIREAVCSGAVDAEAVGERLGAGTNCGSCLAEVRELVRTSLAEETA